MDFFENPPPPDRNDPGAPFADRVGESRRWAMAPVAADTVVARSATAVLYLHLVEACPVGFGFGLMAVPHPDHPFHPLSVMPFPVPAEAAGQVPPDLPGAAEFLRTRADSVERGLRVGIRFDDDTELSSAYLGDYLIKAADTDSPILMPTGSWSTRSTGAAPTRWLVMPLPPAGLVTITVSWEMQGISPTEHVVDGTALHEAASAAVRLSDAAGGRR